MIENQEFDEFFESTISRAIGLGEALTEEQKQRVFEMRARQLAHPIADTEDSAGETIRVLSFQLGEETYAFPAASVTSVSKSIAVAPVPCVPKFVAGITNLRGHIRSVVNLGMFLSIELPEPPDYVVVTQYEDMEVAFLVSKLDEVTDIMVKNIKPRPQLASTNNGQYVSGLVPGGLIILDLAAIFTDERFIVNDEIT